MWQLIEKGDSVNKGFAFMPFTFISSQGEKVRSLVSIFLNKEEATLKVGLFFREWELFK